MLWLYYVAWSFNFFNGGKPAKMSVPYFSEAAQTGAGGSTFFFFFLLREGDSFCFCVVNMVIFTFICLIRNCTREVSRMGWQVWNLVHSSLLLAVKKSWGTQTDFFC